MVNKAKFTPGRIESVRKPLQDLSERDNRKTRREAAEPLETDTSNPDTRKARHPHENDNLIRKIIGTGVSEGWIKPVNSADEFPGDAAVVNSMARRGFCGKECGRMKPVSGLEGLPIPALRNYII